MLSSGRQTALPGYVLLGDDSGEPRPWLIMNYGSDGLVADRWAQGAAAGLRRGYNVLLCDGPGQGAPLWRQNLCFRLDWKKVITPVVDFLAGLLFQLGDYTLTAAELQQITTPLLIADPEGEQFWPGQSQRLYDCVTGPKDLLWLTAAEGADLHCQPKANGLANQRFFDGFARYLQADAGTPAP